MISVLFALYVILLLRIVCYERYVSHKLIANYGDSPTQTYLYLLGRSGANAEAELGRNQADRNGSYNEGYRGYEFDEESTLRMLEAMDKPPLKAQESQGMTDITTT